MFIMKYMKTLKLNDTECFKRRANDCLELLDAIKQKQSDKLESIISKTYQRSPLAKELHQELATAEKVLAYVKKRDHVQRGSTWKFEYEPDQVLMWVDKHCNTGF